MFTVSTENKWWCVNFITGTCTVIHSGWWFLYFCFTVIINWDRASFMF